MKVSEDYAVCRCRKCAGARRLAGVTVTAGDDEQDRLEAIREALKQGRRLITAQDVRYAIERADWALDFPEFCRLLGLRDDERDSRAMDLWEAFHSLDRALGALDNDQLSKLIEFGLTLKDVAAHGQLVISMQ